MHKIIMKVTEGKLLDCKQIQKKIEKFEEDQLKSAELYNFISHIENCEDCREELEIYYIIKYGLDENERKIDKQYTKLLNEYDFKGLVERKIKDQKVILDKMFKHEKQLTIYSVVSNVIMFLTVIIFIILKYF